MSENSPIEWTDHTFNPWWGCAKVSPACDYCYAERDAKRFAPGRVLWGVGAERRTFGEAHWAEPLKWNRRAAERGVRERVFCASMADVFDKDAPDGERTRLLNLINDTPHLDWLLLTKRIGNAQRMLDDFCASDGNIGARWSGWPNVWLGITVVNQEEADRDIPKLLAVPARVRFLSIEPMLGPVDDIRFAFADAGVIRCPRCMFGTNRLDHGPCPNDGETLRSDPGVDWVIAGGESGPHARPAHPDWFRSLRDQCAAAGVPFLFKQWGEWVSVSEVAGEGPHHVFADHARVRRLGKKAAGRLLDGVAHDGVPA